MRQRGILLQILVSLACIATLSCFASQVRAEDWIYWEGTGHCYLPVSRPETISWDQAKVEAEMEGGNLATIQSSAENEFVFSLVADDVYWTFNAYVCGPWLGGYQPDGAEEPDGGWLWLSGDSLEFTNWYLSEPNDGWDGGEDYLHFAGGWGGPPASTWNDLNQYQLTYPIVGYVIESENLDLCVDPGCYGDVDGDAVVDPLDAGFVLSRLGCEYPGDGENCLTADVNDDGEVDPLDVGAVLARFGSCE